MYLIPSSPWCCRLAPSQRTSQLLLSDRCGILIIFQQRCHQAECAMILLDIERLLDMCGKTSHTGLCSPTIKKFLHQFPWVVMKSAGRFLPKHPITFVPHGTHACLPINAVHGQKETIVSYSDLLLQAKTLATALRNPQLPKCALVLLPKVPAWWVMNVAASWCGTIVSCGTTMLTPRDVAHRLSKCGADCIICTPELAASLDEITKSLPLRIVVSDSQEDIRGGWICYNELLESCHGRPAQPCVATRGDDISQLFFTSGTTGKPKMVPHTQASFTTGHIGTIRLAIWLNFRL
ncbi:Acyl-coenzyme A synthetase ACSM3, mitochondrial [Portunus trituberculatus]|uniref:medium-chain acyl-CoA ligase n=1 Tax=Portunus trituberculatus TaxID=210409 RepID=A0A5B7FEW6_PORTR|nr:Acyl-coenzyme A synthetase ACSM3, mitochondrial [Portunus trituberculatus]